MEYYWQMKPHGTDQIKVRYSTVDDQPIEIRLFTTTTEALQWIAEVEKVE
jgi:hypothetical protein